MLISSRNRRPQSYLRLQSSRCYTLTRGGREKLRFEDHTFHLSPPLLGVGHGKILSPLKTQKTPLYWGASILNFFLLILNFFSLMEHF